MPRTRTPRVVAGDKAYREAHREEANRRTREWALANPEKRRATERAYRQKNKRKIREQKKAWRKANPDKHNAANKRWKINAMLKLCDFDALLAQQNGKCAICRNASTGRKKSGRLAIDHCHSTGKVRGLLCHRCNTMLGQSKDSPEILRAAALYLEAS